MTAEPISVPDDVPVAVPTVEEAEHALHRALTDADGYRIEPPCGQAPDMWFPEVGEQNNEARELCVDACPGVMQCRVLAAVARESAGIWGGVAAVRLLRMSAEERESSILTWISGA